MAKGKVKMSMFKNLALQTLKGKTAEDTSDEIFEDAKHSIEGQISALKHSLTQKKRDVRMAKTKLTESYVNGGQAIDDSGAYVQNLVSANDRVGVAEAIVTKTEDTIKFLQDTLKAFEVEVEVAE
jgi:hypothetical protein